MFLVEIKKNIEENTKAFIALKTRGNKKILLIFIFGSQSQTYQLSL